MLPPLILAFFFTLIGVSTAPEHSHTLSQLRLCIDVECCDEFSRKETNQFSPRGYLERPSPFLCGQCSLCVNMQDSAQQNP